MSKQRNLGDEFDRLDDRVSTTQKVLYEQIKPVVEDLEDRVDELEAENERLRERLDDTSDKEGKVQAIVQFAINKRDGEPVVKISAQEIKGATGVSRRYAYDLVEDLPDRESWFLTPEEMHQYGSVVMDFSNQKKCLGVDFEGVHSAGVPVNKFTTSQGGKGGE